MRWASSCIPTHSSAMMGCSSYADELRSTGVCPLSSNHIDSRVDSGDQVGRMVTAVSGFFILLAMDVKGTVHWRIIDEGESVWFHLDAGHHTYHQVVGHVGIGSQVSERCCVVDAVVAVCLLGGRFLLGDDLATVGFAVNVPSMFVECSVDCV